MNKKIEEKPKVASKKNQGVWWKSRWFIGVGATVATLAVGIAVATPVALTIKNLGEKVVADLGVSPDKSTVSSLENGDFKANSKTLNIVALGDSETAGFNGVDYSAGIPAQDYLLNGTSDKTLKSNYGQDLISYADYAALIMRNRGRDVSYVNLAKSGATSSDLLNVLTKRETQEVLSKANLVTLTIGANDLLRGFMMLGIPYDLVSSLLTGGLESNVAENKKVFGFDINFSDKEKVVLLNKLLANLQTTLANKPEEVFSVNKEIILKALKNASGEILRAVSLIHDLAPGAQIVFNDYVYPFNRWVHNGKNITEAESDVYRDLGFSTSTLKGTYDYVLGKVGETVTSNFRVAKFFSLQKAETEAINELVTSKFFTTKEEGLEYFQKNFADIHPTEFGHILLGQKFFNQIIAPAIGEEPYPKASDTNEVTKFNNLLSAAKARIVSSKKNLMSDFFEFLVNNSDTKVENKFISSFFNTAMKPFTLSDGSKADPMLSFIGQLYLMLSGGEITNTNTFFEEAFNVKSTQYMDREKLIQAITLLMESSVFAKTDEAQANFKMFTATGAESFKPYLNFGADRFSYIAKWVITQSTLAHVNVVIGKFATTIASLPVTLRAEIKAKYPVFNLLDSTDPDVLTKDNILKMVASFFASVTSVDTPPSTQGLTNANVIGLINGSFAELKIALQYAQAAATAFPNAFKRDGVTRQITWRDLILATINKNFTPIAS